ncbi:hypothetical protein QFC22_004782 [Naganishia vaughanmartiniae]|uniref:Uncharacterized protein n=1 Tax=Naganishia vaughanmartiniae TaxID=1424756 RepID=A0ACC2X0P9_9TREE|nr:hypothetical protein QFC22_004782 [Naganishia vaughanmartiniae]
MLKSTATVIQRDGNLSSKLRQTLAVYPCLLAFHVPDNLLSERYIYFSGTTPWFWEELVDTLPAEEVNLGSDEIVQRHFPRLRSVVRTETVINVEIPKSIWLTIQDANNKRPTTGLPVAKVVEQAYKAGNISNLSPAVIPKFVSSYRPIDANKSSKPKGKKQCDVPGAQTRCPRTLQRFQSDFPDAVLRVDMVFIKRSLDFHLLSGVVKDVDYRQQIYKNLLSSAAALCTLKVGIRMGTMPGLGRRVDVRVVEYGEYSPYQYRDRAC